ncbi:MAG: L,D-transpeptidase [Armatimonadetes bacterium]|nr:L,D-transpeptidase [Armatimonadota bacterium]
MRLGWLAVSTWCVAAAAQEPAAPDMVAAQPDHQAAAVHETPPHVAEPPITRRVVLSHRAQPRVRFAALPAELVEGDDVALGWEVSEGVYSVSIVGDWADAALGGEPRDHEQQVLTPARDKAPGALRWQVPWLDTVAVRLKLKGFARDASVVGVAEATLPYRPRPLRDRREDGVYVWLTGSHGQRLYLQERDRLVWNAVCSGAEGGRLLPAWAHPERPHDHLGVFDVQWKTEDHYSSLNPLWRMRYCLFFLAGHAIHATSRNMYRYLGEPASHGCVRLHLAEARWLFPRVPRGTRVEIL